MCFIYQSVLILYLRSSLYNVRNHVRGIGCSNRSHVHRRPSYHGNQGPGDVSVCFSQTQPEQPAVIRACPALG